MNELKPCPFCGGTDIYISSSKASDMSIHRVACSTCPAMAESMIDGYDEVIKAWNTRDKSHLNQKIRTATLDELDLSIENLSEFYVPMTPKNEKALWKSDVNKAIDNLRGESDE